MFEARLVQGNLLKKLCDGLKDLVTEVNLDVSSTGITCQAMDSSHVCLVATHLRADGFDHFRCDRNLTLGVSIPNLAKVLKCAGEGRRHSAAQHACVDAQRTAHRDSTAAHADKADLHVWCRLRAGNDDIITLKAEDNGDMLTLMFESEKDGRVSDFDLKLMSIESEQLGIPDQDYSAEAKIPASEYQRICRCGSGAACTGVLVVVPHSWATHNSNACTVALYMQLHGTAACMWHCAVGTDAVALAGGSTLMSR